jgi:hypothetical protein
MLMLTPLAQLGKLLGKRPLIYLGLVIVFLLGMFKVFSANITPYVVNDSSHPNVALLSLEVAGEDMQFSLPKLRTHPTVFLDHWPHFKIKRNLHEIEIVVQPEGASIEKYTCTVKGGGFFTWGQIEISYKNNGIDCWFVPNDDFVG